VKYVNKIDCINLLDIWQAIDHSPTKVLYVVLVGLPYRGVTGHCRACLHALSLHHHHHHARLAQFNQEPLLNLAWHSTDMLIREASEESRRGDTFPQTGNILEMISVCGRQCDCLQRGLRPLSNGCDPAHVPFWPVVLAIGWKFGCRYRFFFS
jgi:hypothetical protein